jgi:hypothetical protein
MFHCTSLLSTWRSSQLFLRRYLDTCSSLSAWTNTATGCGIIVQRKYHGREKQMLASAREVYLYSVLGGHRGWKVTWRLLVLEAPILQGVDRKFGWWVIAEALLVGLFQTQSLEPTTTSLCGCIEPADTLIPLLESLYENNDLGIGARYHRTLNRVSPLQQSIPGRDLYRPRKPTATTYPCCNTTNEGPEA